MTLLKNITYFLVWILLFVISGFDVFTLAFFLILFWDSHNKNPNENNQLKKQTFPLFVVTSLLLISHHQIISHIFKDNKVQLCGTVIQSYSQSFSRSPLLSPNLTIKTNNQTKSFRVDIRVAPEINSRICVNYLQNNSISFFDDYVLDIQKIEN